MFRKFHSLEEAEAFVMHGSVQLASNQVPVVSSAHPGKMDLRSRKPYDKPIAATAPAPALPGEAVEIVVYTDGAAKNNQGGFGVIKRAGVGVWWADGDPRYAPLGVVHTLLTGCAGTLQNVVQAMKAVRPITARNSSWVSSEAYHGSPLTCSNRL